MIASAKHAIHVFVTQPWLIILSALVDILFFFAYGFITAFPRNELLVRGLNLGQTVSQVLQTASARYEVPTLTQVLFDPLAKPHLFSVIQWMLILFVTATVVYFVFQAFAWKLAGLKNIKAFGLVTLVWFSIIGLLYVAMVLVDMRNTMVFALTETPVSPWLHWVLFTLIMIAVYLLIVSYGLLAHHSWKKAITHAFRHAFTPRVLLPCVALAAAAFLLQVGLRWISTQSLTFGMLLSAVIVFPLLYFARLYLINVMSHVR